MVQEFQTHFLSCLCVCLSVSSHTQGSVSINSSNGQLSVDQPLDHELADSYRLLVVASSGGVQATTLVVITVENVNEQPLFTKDVYKVHILCVLLYLTDDIISLIYLVCMCGHLLLPVVVIMPITILAVLWLHGFMHCAHTMHTHAHTLP